MVTTLGWTLLVGAVLALATQFVGTPNAPIAAVQTITPFALVPLVIGAVAAAVLGRHALAGATALVACGYLVATVPLAFPDRGPRPADDSTPFVVAAANLLYSNDRVGDTADVLQSLDADVLAFAEITPEHADELRRHPLAARYPHRVERTERLARGLAVWSTFPLQETTSGDSERAIRARLDAPDGPVRIVLAHPPPPVFNRSLWASELRALERVDGQRTIVLGDLNATIFHPPLRRLLDRASLFDAIAAGGRELSATWPTDLPVPPFARIDHILLSRDLAVVDADVVALPGSDHHAVVATVAGASGVSRG